MYFSVRNLKKSFHKNKLVLKNLSFSMNKGEILSFVGESGSGKSTFLNCISGLENIDSGTIILNEKILNGKGKTVRAQDRRIGHVFQDNPLFPHLTLLKNILFNLKKIDKKNLDEVISVSGLKIYSLDFHMSYQVEKNKEPV
jgi:ABC-type Fe3+/spermidine/putrescine transport system ATPase subunit